LGKDPNLLPSSLLNQPVPSFSASSLKNRDENITTNDLKGKITLLNVWATWCGMCRIEHPILIDLARNYPIQVYGLNYKDQATAATKFLNEQGNPYQKIIFDPQGKIAMQFGVYGTPETYLIDSKGIIRYRYVGPMTLEIVEKDLLPRIKQMEGDY
jgi:cytochrome c biogenesis protein CcmG/thiol:disulfide interchange protein DsbE